MRIFAIGDLHLSFGTDKPMDVFGEQWQNHAERLKNAWESTISDEDIVLVPGDISWAISLADAQADLDFVGNLPGTKVLLRGNHDYWWSSVTQIRRLVDKSVKIVQNDTVSFPGVTVSDGLNGVTIGGTRGWTIPAPEVLPEGGESGQDRHIYERELMRLEMSLSKLEGGRHRLAMLHFPPLDIYRQDTRVTALLEKYGIETAVYAHLHGPAHKMAFQGVHNGIRYQMVSSDYLGFEPCLIGEYE